MCACNCGKRVLHVCGKFLSCSISQLNKQLVEQQSAVTNDKHENGTDTSTSDSQPDSLSALKEKIAELEDELETAKLEHKKTTEKLKVCSYMCVHTPMCSSDMTNCTYVEPYWDHTLVIDSVLVHGHITAHRVYTVHVWGVGGGRVHCHCHGSSVFCIVLLHR